MDARHDLTERQASILAFIVAAVHAGLPPTVRELQTAFGIKSTNGVAEHLRALERKGYLTRDRLLSRGIRLVDGPHVPPLPPVSPSNRLVSVPIYNLKCR